MPEVNYAPDPRPQPPYTVPSRGLGRISGPLNINSAAAISSSWTRQAADTQGVSLEMSKRGAIGSAGAAVTANTGIFQLRGFGWNGLTYAAAGRMQLNVNPTADFSAGNSGSYVRFQVVAPSTTVEAESFRSYFNASAAPMLSLGGVAATNAALKSVAGAPPSLMARTADDAGYCTLQAGFVQGNAVDAVNNDITVAGEVYHSLSSGTPAASMASGMDWRSDANGGVRQLQARLGAFWEDATLATMTSHLRVSVQNAGSTLEVLRVGPTGLFTFQTKVVGARNTGWVTFTGTANKNAGALDTGTATTAQVAQVVKSILDALITHGLLGA